MKLVIDMKWMESKPPPVSIKDRTIVGTIDQGLNSTNHMPEVGGSRNRSAVDLIYNDSLNSDLLRWAWNDGGCWIVCHLRVLREFAVRDPSPGFWQA